MAEHPVRSAVVMLVFTVIPALTAYWYLLSTDPPLPLLRRELSVLGSPDVDLASILLAIPLLVGLGLIAYIAKVSRDQRPVAEMERRNSAKPPIEPGTEITSDGVPWVWDGERAWAQCPEHPGTDLLYRANGHGATTGPPADRSSLLDSHEGGHLICPKHADQRRSLGEPETYGEARRRAENAMRARSKSLSPHPRRVFDAKGGSIRAEGVRARNQDTVFKTEDTEVEARDIDAE